jgi:hypothetical protein
MESLLLLKRNGVETVLLLQKVKSKKQKIFNEAICEFKLVH